MRVGFAVILSFGCAFIAGCGGAKATFGGGDAVPPPVISSQAAQNGAAIVQLTPGQQGLPIYYTMDGSTPTAAAQIYQAPFLVASNLTVNAVSVLDSSTSTVSSQFFSPNIPSGTLVW